MISLVNTLAVAEEQMTIQQMKLKGMTTTITTITATTNTNND
jgi:hypothetical protein